MLLKKKKKKAPQREKKLRFDSGTKKTWIEKSRDINKIECWINCQIRLRCTEPSTQSIFSQLILYWKDLGRVQYYFRIPKTGENRRAESGDEYYKCCSPCYKETHFYRKLAKQGTVIWTESWSAKAKNTRQLFSISTAPEELIICYG